MIFARDASNYMPNIYDKKLALDLILDEIFDLALYERFRARATGDLATTLDALITIEKKHIVFWEAFFDERGHTLNIGRRIKLSVLSGITRAFGDSAIYMILEAIEVYGIRKYLHLWDAYKDAPLGKALRQVLQDEFEHEDAIVSRRNERGISPERIRNIFLGFNDGLVEILGAVSGFFAAFSDATHVLAAGIAVAVAGSISMAAGVFVSSGSEYEVARTEREKQAFLGGTTFADALPSHPFRGAFTVGISYFIGALVPILPVLFGAGSPLISAIAGATMAILISLVLAFLSGMDIRRRIVTNIVIIALALSISYGLGIVAKTLLGIAL